MLKLLINIFIIYGIWQLIRMFFSVQKVQKQFHQNMADMNEQMNQRSGQNTTSNKGRKPLDNEGEYVDYEEIK